MKKVILSFLVFTVFSVPILCSFADEKETYSESDSIVNELLEGKDWKNNRKAAKEAFQKILEKLIPKAETGDSEAQYQLGRHFDYGWGVERDALKAAKWYEKAAIQSHIEAQHSLGLLHTHAGNYVFSDPGMSVKWFRAAAEQGHPSSQHCLAIAYEEGNGVIRNYSEAAKWYQKAAFQGDMIAMHGLAGLYARGLGVPKDLVNAYAWNNVSATQGWGPAKTYREKLETMMSKDQIDKAQTMSVELFQKYGTEPKY
jgi:uncharacterized protein